MVGHLFIVRSTDLCVCISNGEVEGPSKQSLTDGGWVQSTFGAKAEHIFQTGCSLQSQSWFYNGPNQDSKNMATCPYQLTHRKLSF